MVETRSSKRQREQASSSRSSARQASAHQRASTATSDSQRRSRASRVPQPPPPLRGAGATSDDSDEEEESDSEDDEGEAGVSRSTSGPAQPTQLQPILFAVNRAMSVFDPDMRVPGEDALLAPSGVRPTESGAAFRQITAALARASLTDPQLRAELTQAVPTALWARETATRLRRRLQHIFHQLGLNITRGSSVGSDVHDTSIALRNLSQALRLIVRDHFAPLAPSQRRPFIDLLVDLATTVLDWDRDAYAESNVTRPPYAEERNLYLTLIGDAGTPLFVVDVLAEAGPAEYRHQLPALSRVYQGILERFQVRNPGAPAQLNAVVLAWNQVLQAAAPPQPWS